MRLIQHFNQGWLFTPHEVEQNASDKDFEAVTLPHTNKLFPQRYVDNLAYQFISTYRKRFDFEQDLSGKRIFLDFDGAMLRSSVYLNGAFLGEHRGGYSPFSFDITEQLNQGENCLTVYVDATEDPNIPPYGGRVDFLTFGGLYRDVYLRIVDEYHIFDAFVRPLNVLSTPELACDLKLSAWGEGLRLEAVLQDAAGKIIAQAEQVLTSEAESIHFTALEGVQLWTLEQPTLYTLVLTLFQAEQVKDNLSVTFGFRAAEFSADGSFYLNGQPLKLIGLNRHQTYPYIGAAAPARLQILDADILKYELGCNIVRTSHYPQSPHFLKRCDEIGLLVFEEIAGWQHIGDAAWQALILQDLRAMIERDRNHPAIILWGVRVNESPDDEVFYTQTNALAHELDPTRQTGGVRNFISSQRLEDVFTLNDFREGIQTPIHQPHLITEFAGHMFPTKTWDHEERRIGQALKHADKQNLQMGRADVAGAIGWCAFDYHTHREFGSGDRICHHGVMDMYRLPKFAAYFYRSQKSPQDEIVLQAATNWTMGDRSAGGNNPLIVFSNCDEIEVFIGDVSQGCFSPDAESYPHLKHPPFIIRWPEPYNPWGATFNDLHIKGYLNGVLMAEQKIDSAHQPHELHLSSHTSSLKADGSDMARVVVAVVDKYTNVLPYQQLIVNFTLEGNAELIGENLLVLLGGQAAIYLKSGHQAGTVRLTAEAFGLAPASLTLQIEA